MARKTYAVMNLSYRDNSRTDDYLLEKVSHESKFFMPANMDEEIQCMYPSELTELICQDTLREIETERYTCQEIDNMLEDLRLEIMALAEKEG